MLYNFRIIYSTLLIAAVQLKTSSLKTKKWFYKLYWDKLPTNESYWRVWLIRISVLCRAASRHTDDGSLTTNRLTVIKQPCQFGKPEVICEAVKERFCLYWYIPLACVDRKMRQGGLNWSNKIPFEYRTKIYLTLFFSKTDVGGFTYDRVGGHKIYAFNIFI